MMMNKLKYTVAIIAGSASQATIASEQEGEKPIVPHPASIYVDGNRTLVDESIPLLPGQVVV